MDAIAKSVRMGIAAATVSGLLAGGSAAASLPPADAAAAGFTQNTLSAFKPGSIDVDDTKKSGFSWYFYHFYGSQPRRQNIVLNSDGSVTFNGDTTGPNGQLATAAPAKNGAKFVGVAFGGGAYIEAAIKFDPNAARSKISNGWPSFWAMSLEHLATGAAQWVGKPPGYEQFIEADFFEYDIDGPNLGLNYYGANLHDWYGVYNQTCPGHPFCDSWRDYSDVKTAVSPTTDFTQYHTYGFLWLPASDSKAGQVQFYFDGSRVGKTITWAKFAHQMDIPDGQPWKFGALDKQHLVLILGTGLGKPMTVGSLNVWQSSNDQNLRN
jgi:hypothetical protein